MKRKVLTIIGARPQIIKSAALSRIMVNNNQIEEIILHTGQHYDENMSEVFFTELNLPRPKYNLNIQSGAHGTQTSNMIIGIENVINIESPDLIILYGDTNSTLAGAIASVKVGIPIGHIEAGLRSYNKSMPEEINRVLCDHCSTLLFAPTETAINNLSKEGIIHHQIPNSVDNPAVIYSGDVMYDNSLFFANIAVNNNILDRLNLTAYSYVLLTIHRDFNTDNISRLSSIVKAIESIVVSSNVRVVFPVHPRTKKIIQGLQSNEVFRKFLNLDKITLLEPVSFLEMMLLEKNAKIIITDSGGVQKEAFFYKIPSLVLRPETEWVEIVETGNAKIVDADYFKIIEGYKFFDDKNFNQSKDVFGSGNAADVIFESIASFL